MTDKQKSRLDYLYGQCTFFCSNDKNYDDYERYKKAIKELNLTPDEYEYATTKIARIIGL